VLTALLFPSSLPSSSQGVGAHGVLKALLDSTDYEEFLKKHNPDFDAKGQNVQELVSSFSSFFRLSLPIASPLAHRPFASPYQLNFAHEEDKVFEAGQDQPVVQPQLLSRPSSSVLLSRRRLLLPMDLMG